MPGSGRLPVPVIGDNSLAPFLAERLHAQRHQRFCRRWRRRTDCSRKPAGPVRATRSRAWQQRRRSPSWHRHGTVRRPGRPGTLMGREPDDSATANAIVSEFRTARLSSSHASRPTPCCWSTPERAMPAQWPLTSKAAVRPPSAGHALPARSTSTEPYRSNSAAGEARLERRDRCTAGAIGAARDSGGPRRSLPPWDQHRRPARTTARSDRSTRAMPSVLRGPLAHDPTSARRRLDIEPGSRASFASHQSLPAPGLGVGPPGRTCLLVLAVRG